MPPMNQKNYAMNPAVSDLGLGDQLSQQLDDQEEERKKKLLQAVARARPSVASSANLPQPSTHSGSGA